MNNNLFFLLMAVIVSLAGMGCKNKIEPLKMATYTYSDNNRIKNLTPLSKELEKVLKRPVVISSYPDIGSLIQAMASEEVDIGFINTLGYLLYSLKNENMSPIATLKIKENAVDNYKTVVLARSDSLMGIDLLKDNSEKFSMMFVAKGSTSGNLIPRLLLSSVGITSPETQFKKVTYGGNHATTFEGLLRGDTDLCAIGSNEYQERIKSDSSILNEIKPIWTSEEIPLGPVVLNNEITPPEKQMITEVLLSLHLTNPEVLENLKQGWSEAKQAEKFYRISDSYYDSFRSINGKNTDLTNILISFKI